MAEITVAKCGNIIIENRRKLTASGVKDVESFLPEKIVLITETANLIITGSGMKVKNLSSQNGEILIEGDIDGCSYTKAKAEKESFLKRVLK